MPSLSERCILAVGDTGNGKSFTATIFGAKNAKIGDSSKSETTEIAIYPIKNGGFYIDTPGFDDSREIRDEETIHKIYLKMLEASIRNLTTILWFVTPDVRAKGSYKRQARFIESLAELYNGNVWDNTIIVTKGNMIFNGPRDAAKEIAQEKRNTNDDLLSGAADFKIFLLEKLSSSDRDCYEDETSDKLNKKGIFKESEPERILAKYESLMERHFEHPIRLELKKVKCSNCSEETDPRFATPKCHEIETFHPSIEREHLGNLIDIHPVPHLYKQHPKGYVSPTYRTEPTGGFIGRVLGSEKVVQIPGYYLCCNGNDPQGCTQFYGCCGREKDQIPGCQKIYDGCRHQPWEERCTKFCNHCKKKSDTNHGCTERCKHCQIHDPRYKTGCVDTPHKFP